MIEGIQCQTCAMTLSLRVEGPSTRVVVAVVLNKQALEHLKKCSGPVVNLVKET